MQNRREAILGLSRPPLLFLPHLMMLLFQDIRLYEVKIQCTAHSLWEIA